MYYSRYTGKSADIVTALVECGIDPSFKNRKRIAIANEILNYASKPTQNTRMLNLLRQGHLIKV